MNQKHLEVRSKQLIEVDGLKFKDLNGNGKLDPYEDWRLSAEERASDLVSQMNIDEKVGMMLINTRNMGLTQEDKSKTSHDGVLDEAFITADGSIFGRMDRYGSTETIERLGIRHYILRNNFKPSEIATWVNTMNEVCESTRLGIPCIIASNSRNENAEPTFGMNDASGIFSTWPATLGLAAAALGDIDNGGDASLISEFANYARKEWAATGIRKGYMYMADVVTDPRWQRTYGTFGESTDFICDAIGRLVEGFQGEKLSDDSIALTTKHFPGGGPRENGFDPHYKEGKWNVYKTPGSLEKYHLPPFKVACEKGTSSIMPYYSAPSIKKSSWQSYEGVNIPYEEVGFAFNEYFMNDVLRDQCGFKGYVNSDSGIVDNMCWGVEELSTEERFAKAVNAGVDIVADSNDITHLKLAIENGWIPPSNIDRANKRLLIEMFELGLFDDKTYVDVEKADEIVATKEHWDRAFDAHIKSVNILKNTDKTLPITVDKAKGKKIYIEVFHKNPEQVEKRNNDAKEIIKEYPEYDWTDDYNEADFALLFLHPKSGNYFSATPGLLELEICENKTNKDMAGNEYVESTLINTEKLNTIAKTVKENGGKVVISINFVLPWIVSSVEPLADAFVANYETFAKAQLDVFFGKAEPSAVLPITLPKGPEVIEVDDSGECISRNDVPGYDKDQYMPEGMSYAYVDSDGNIYKLGHGLKY